MVKFICTFCCLLFTVFAFGQSPVNRSVNDTNEFQYCDADGDGFTTIDVAEITTIVASKHPDLINLTETIYLCGISSITKIENISTTPVATVVCSDIEMPPFSGILDMAVNSSGEFFISGFQAYKLSNCQISETYPIGGNAISFDPNNNMYLPSPGASGVVRSNGTDYTSFSMWHDFNDGGFPAGDFVYINGKIYIAWNLFTETITTKLYEVTVDNDYNYISHVDLGEIPNGTYGLASELGTLYGATTTYVYRIDVADMTLTTVYNNPGNPAFDGWSGASSLHEAGIGVKAYLTQADAQTNSNPLPDSWINTIAGGQTIYVAITNQVTHEVFVFPVVITVLMPNAHQPNDLSLCSPNETAIFDLEAQNSDILGGQSGYTVSYHISQSDADAGINPLTSPYQNTSNPQMIYARITNTGDTSCFDTTTFQLIVIPAPELEMPSDFYICIGQEITISAPDGFESYLWSTGETSQSINVETAGEILLTVTNASGCNASADISITTSVCDIPKGVSVNGDGWNDTFDLAAFDVENLKIFNRYGMVVFEEANYIDGWRGQDKNGNELPTATYYYLLRLTSGETKSGWVYLLQKG